MDAHASEGTHGGADCAESEMDLREVDPPLTYLPLLEEYCLLMKKKALVQLPNPGQWWVRPIWQNRKQESEYYTAMPLLMSGDSEYFNKYYKMSPSKFEELHALVERPLTKQFVVREPLPSGARLAMTLRYLASGMQVQDVAMAFRVGISTADGVIRDTCKLLRQVLQPIFLKMPTTADWEKVAAGFNEKWNFPQCVGAMDGKHVQIQAPPNSGSLYFNYKVIYTLKGSFFELRYFSVFTNQLLLRGTYSIVLLAVADSDLKFVMIDVGAYGRQSDGGTICASKLGKCLERGLFHLPLPKTLPGTTTVAPHVFVGDEAFQLRADFLRPYPGRGLDEGRRIFNYRLSRARCIENAFGVMASRFRIFRRVINLLPQNADYVVMAACVLHNFLADDAVYMPPNYADLEDSYGNVTEGQWRAAAEDEAMLKLEPTLGHNYSRTAAETRDLFKSYFMSSQGAVPWQWASAGLRR